MKTVLFSGGMDSAALAYWVRPQLALTIDYGQKAAEAEISAAKAIASEIGCRHTVLKTLTPLMLMPKFRSNSKRAEWIPYRNQFLITIALMHLSGTEATEIMIGTVRNDALYGDGTPSFISAINGLVQLQERPIIISAPAIKLRTAELIQESGISPAVLAWAHSCNDGNLACGQCRSCVKRQEVLDELAWPAFVSA